MNKGILCDSKKGIFRHIRVCARRLRITTGTVVQIKRSTSTRAKAVQLSQHKKPMNPIYARAMRADAAISTHKEPALNCHWCGCMAPLEAGFYWVKCKLGARWDLRSMTALRGLLAMALAVIYSLVGPKICEPSY
jgi:hypothetical protein